MVSQLIPENPPNGSTNPASGQQDSTFKMVEAELPALKDGDSKVKVLYLSNNPTQRIWINADVPALLERSGSAVKRVSLIVIEISIDVGKSIEALLSIPTRFVTTKYQGSRRFSENGPITSAN